MAKKKQLTREEKKDQVRSTFKEVPVNTNVKAWVFQSEKQYYVVIKYFAARLGYCTVVFPSNRKGIKTSNVAIYEKTVSQDHVEAFERALDILIPEEIVAEEISETEERTIEQA